MTITVNGAKQTVPEATTVTALLVTLGYGEKKVAVAVNEAFLPRSRHAETVLQDGDAVEIVAPMPGG